MEESLRNMESRDQLYKYERNRLETFREWPANAKVEAWKMAKAGLLYTGTEEQVKCSWCDCILTQWQYGDQVMARHRLASPDCPFVQNQSDNVPFLTSGHDTETSVTDTSNVIDTTDMADSDDQDETSLDPSLQEEGVIPHLTDDVGPEPGSLGPRWGTARSWTPRQDSRHSPEGPTELDYKSESVRVATFANWSVAFISPTDLAKAGFYSLGGGGDGCKCAFCHNCVGDWVEGDDPMTEHRALFPLCRFVQGHEVGNIPTAGGGETTREQESSPGHDETGIRWNSRHSERNSQPEKQTSNSHTANILAKESFGVMRHEGPLHPQHATIEARLRTFRDWPPALKQQPSQLTEAGFYYIGLSDQVKCFYCDGGLRNWQPEDLPWVEHARWFSRCVYVRLVKGDEFITQCLLERPPEKTGISFDMPRPVTEEELRRAMGEAIVKQVLSMGIDHSRVKMAIKQQLEKGGGAPFSTPESLISAAFSVQRNQERRIREENLNPVGAMLEGLEHRGHRDRVSEHWGGGELLGGGGVSNNIASQSSMEDELVSQSSDNNTVNLSLVSQSLPPSPREESGGPTCTSLPLPVPSKEPSTDLVTENARLKEQRTCKICMDGEVGVVFLPCGHLCCCVNCAPSLKDCPVCRSTIQGTVRTFLS